MLTKLGDGTAARAKCGEGRLRFEVIKLKPVDVMWVGLGGGLGSVLRWWIGRLVGAGDKGRFPLGTFLINLSGGLLIGYLSVLFNVDWHNRHGHFMVLNALVITGILGGYTTFSSMQLDAARLATTRHAHLAVFYLLLSVAAGLLAALAGAALARAQG
jgi:fluoride exporter